MYQVMRLIFLVPFGFSALLSFEISNAVAQSSMCGGVAVQTGAGSNACIEPGSGQTFRDCPTCPAMVVVPAGKFTMGSGRGEKGRSNAEGPQRSVALSKPFAVGKFEVTFAEWDACVDDGGCSHRPDDKGWGRGNRPIINVSWNHITRQYLPWLSRKTGHSYRLLSEAEWEYAARAGTGTAYWWGNKAVRANANCKGCSGRWAGKKSAPTGSFPANPFGIHDMNGNVFELVADCWNKSHRRTNSDGRALTRGNCDRRVIKGGSWFTPTKWLRSATRSSDPVGYSNANVGFRVARSLQTEPKLVRSDQISPERASNDEVARQKRTAKASSSTLVEFELARRLPTGRCRRRLARLRKGVRSLRVRLPLGQTNYVGEPIRIDLSHFPVGLSNNPGGDLYALVAKHFEVGGTLFLKHEEPDAGGQHSVSPASIRGQGASVPVYQHKTGAEESLYLTPVKAGSYEIKFVVATKKSFRGLKEDCPQATIAQSSAYTINVVDKPPRPRLEEPVFCHLKGGASPLSSTDVTTRSTSESGGPVKIGESVTVRWALSRKLNPNCRTPLYLVASTSARTRFEGQGFLAIPKNQPGPFDIRYATGRTRLFFPLHLLDTLQGEFKIKAFQVGTLELDWALVEVPRIAGDPRTRNDFALGKEFVLAEEGRTKVARFTASKPRIVVRDNYTLDQPKKLIRSNSGEFDLHIFDKFFRVLDAGTGELVLERTGIDPNFSPGGRFVSAFVEGDRSLETIDLYSQEQTYAGDSSFLAWAHGDAFLVPGENVGWGSLPTTVLNVRQSLVDNSTTSFPNLEYYKTATENWLVSLDLEGAIVAVQDLTERLGRGYGDGGRAWSSFIDRSHNSMDLARLVRKQTESCRKIKLGVLSIQDHRCINEIETAVERRLSEASKRAFFTRSRLFNAPVTVPATWSEPGSSDGIWPPMPWFSGGKRVALSQTGEAHELDRFRKDHQSIAAGLSHLGQANFSDARLLQSRTTINRNLRQQGATGTVASDIPGLLHRVEYIGIPIAQDTSTSGQIVGLKGFDRRDESVRFIKSRVAARHRAAGQLIPPNDDDFRKKHFDWACYSQNKRYGDQRAIADPLDSGAVSHLVEFKTEKRGLWLFQTECSNGASGRYTLWLLTGSRGQRPELRDLSHELRFNVGQGRTDMANFGEIGFHSAQTNSLGFGSWPQSVDWANISFDRYLVAHGKWPGGRWGLIFDLELREIKTFIPNVENADSFGQFAITRDGRTLVQANTNGQLFFYDASTGKVILRGVETDDELIIYDESGYFLSSPEGGQFLHLKFPGIPGYSSVAQFSSTLNRPDLVKAILAGKSDPPKPVLTAPPELRIAATVSGQGPQRLAKMSFETSSEVGLKELVVFVDGRPVKRVPLTGESQQGDAELELSTEARWLSAVAIDRSDYRSVERNQALPGASAPDRSHLFAITVGTDIYEDPKISRLNAAKRDAANFGQLASTLKGGLYGDVELTALLDSPDLTTALLNRIREVVREAGPNDTIMLFAAGHGDQGKDGAFYLVTRSTKLSDIESTAIRWSDIAAAFDGVKARVVVFLDACRSGAAGQSGSNDDAVAALLRGKAPILVLAASKGRQNSEETSRGGYFTNEIIRAVARERDKTDTNGNGAIELAELYVAIKARVVRATENNKTPGKQTPWIARNEMVGEIPLF